MTKQFDVVAIGNAIVDVLSFTDDTFIASEGISKGGMMLIDEQRAHSLYAKMGPCTEISGGSAANTLAGMASLGAKTAFIGKVFNDELGRIFRHDMNAAGVSFTTPAADAGKSTARCLILVTPDGQRTMNTFIGACNELYVADIDEALIAEANILYGEGYMWDQPCAKEALLHSFTLAKKRGAKIAFTLSDAFCVDRYREDFHQLLKDHFDILFCNEAEIQAMYPDKAFEDILNEVQGKASIIAITRGEKGSLILTPAERITVDALRVSSVVDTTGAGDLYAAGFMHGFAQGKPLAECGRLGSACAAEIITHLGARPQKPLKSLVA